MKHMIPRVFRLLLRLYPRSYRERYGDEMEAFHRLERAAGGGGMWYWLRAVGDHLHASITVRRGGGDGVMKTFLTDLSSGARALRRARSFALFAVLTLALGIGATTAVFSVVDRVVFRPLPYPASERMALVGIDARYDPGNRGPLSAPLAIELIAHPGPAEAVVSAGSSEMILRGAGDPARVRVTGVSEGFFPFFGAKAQVGRLLTDADQAPDAARAVVLGYGFWQEHYGGATDALGSTVQLDDEPYTVVGVLPRDFVAPPEMVDEDDVWIPLRLRAGDPDRGTFFMVGVAWLRPGTTVQEMEAYMDGVVGEIYPPDSGPNFVTGGVAQEYRTQIAGRVAGDLERVLAAVALLLLIACVNVASLLLTRGTQRAHELSVRTALGAGRKRLIAQLLSESLVLAFAGGVVGSALAYASVELFRRYAPDGLPRLGEVGVDARGLGFALALAVSTVVLFGLLPALRSARHTGTMTAHRSRTASPGRRDRRLREVLVILETALAVVLAVGSGLLTRDFVRMAGADPGFRPEGAAAMDVDLAPRYGREEWGGMWARFLDGARALPGVEAAALATQVPFTGDRTASTYRPEGLTEEELKGVFVITVDVAGDYLGALGTHMAQGRPFGPEDDGSDPTAVVNEAFVRRFWPEGAAVGRLVRSGGQGVDDEPVYRVVGVMADVAARPGRDPLPTIFLPVGETSRREMEVIARTDGNAVTLAAGLRDLARTLDSQLPVTSTRTVASLSRVALARPRFYATLFGGFAAVALLLAVVGVYGTTAYATRERTREIGIRMALGARQTRVIGAVVARTGTAVGIGVAIGLAAAALASRVMVDVLHRVDVRDVTSYVIVGALVLLAGIVATWIPAGQAGRIDPAKTLRQDG